MKEEDKIKKLLQGREPFKVPENFFEDFTKEIMEKLPEQEICEEPEITLWTKIKPWLYMAAMFVGIMLSVRIFVGNPQHNKIEQLAATLNEASDEYVDEIADRTLMDDYTLYEYLTEANGDYLE